MKKNIQPILSDISADILEAHYIGEGAWWMDERGHNWWNRNTHFDYNALYLTVDGAFDLTVNGIPYHIEKNRVFFIPAGSDLVFHINNDGKLCKYYTHFYLTLSGTELKDAFDIPAMFEPSDAETIRSYFEKMMQLMESKDDPTVQIALNSALLGLVSEMLMQAKARPSEKTVRIPAKMREAAAYLENHIADGYSVNEAAEHIGYSAAHFSKKFKAAYGRTPTEYLAELKIRLARERLKHTDASISEIASALGFSDTSYFSSFFKTRTGLSPAFFRKDMPK